MGAQMTLCAQIDEIQGTGTVQISTAMGVQVKDGFLLQFLQRNFKRPLLNA